MSGERLPRLRRLIKENSMGMWNAFDAVSKGDEIAWHRLQFGGGKRH